MGIASTLMSQDLTNIALSIQSKTNLNNTLNECTKLRQQFGDLEQMVKKFRV